MNALAVVRSIAERARPCPSLSSRLQLRLDLEIVEVRAGLEARIGSHQQPQAAFGVGLYGSPLLG